MAKLSVYNTIDRSQLGGKFVPLIQSGVNNYKILASDLGKEYSPGDAIEITDTGVINVKFRPDDFDVSSGSLTIKTDEPRGVFKGSNGIYIASADDSIGISRTGIKVNTESLIGPGLELHAGNMISVKTNAPLYTYDHGVSLSIGGDLYVTNEGALYVNSAAIRDSAKQHVYKYIGNSLSVDQGYLVVNTNYIASGFGLTTGYGEYGPISVDIEDVASAIGNNYIGSGLYFNNSTYTFSANVNTATGITVKDNKLYLNAGAGLQTSNNSVSVKPADSTINVGSGGVKVKIKSVYSGLGANSEGLYVKSADSSISINHEGIRVSTGYGLSANSAGLYVKPADNSIVALHEGIKVNYGSGLFIGSYGLSVKSADSSIGSHELGIRVNTSYGLSANSAGLCVEPADGSIDVSYDGIKVNTSVLAHSLPGKGLRYDEDDGRISVYTDNDTLKLRGTRLYVDTTYVSGAIVGAGLKAHSNGTLYVSSANNFIYSNSFGVGLNMFNLYSHIDQTSSNIEYNGSLNAIVAIADGGTKITSLYSGSGISVNSTGSIDVNVDNSKGLCFDKGKLTLYANSGSLGFSSTGELYVKDKDPGWGLESRSGTYYIKSADNSIGASEVGIKVNPSALVGFGLRSFNDSLYVKSANNTISVDSGGISVYYGSGLRRATEDNGQLSVYIGSGLYFDSLGAICSSTSSVTAGHGIASDGETLYIRSANKTLIASGINLDVNTDTLAGVGLGHTYSNLYVMSADNSIGVSAAGIKVNSSALVGASLYVDSANNTLNVDSSLLAGKGLKSDGSYLNVHIGSFASVGLGYSESSLYVLSADNSIEVSNAGIRVNTMNVAGDGLGGANNTLYVNSAWIAGHGLMSNASGKLEIYCGSGLALDTSSGKVYVTSALTPDFGKGMWLASDNDSLLSVYAGSGLMFDTQNRVSVYAGSGLTLVGPEGEASLQVKAGGNNTISVFESGIEVNAGPGLCYAGSLYIQSADNSINVATDGITVNYGDGLFMNGSSKLAVNAGSGLQVSEIEKKLTVYAGSGLGFDTYGNSLEVKNADNSISVTSDGIKVAEGFGLPDYSSGVTATQNTEYTADTNCWMYMEVSNSSSAGGAYVEKSIVIDGITVAGLSAYYWTRIAIMVPCKKGSTYQFKNKNTGQGSYTFTVYKCLE